MATFFDQHRLLPATYSFAFGSRVKASIEGLDMDEVASAYLRPHPYCRLPELSDPKAPSEYRTEDYRSRLRRFSSLLVSWFDLSASLVVNRLANEVSNTSKLYQQILIEAAGFKVPDSLATTDPLAARAFVEKHQSVIYKSLSGIRSIVRRLPASEMKRLENVVSCPTLFQAHIPGIDYRAHVVGDRVFACQLMSGHDDYRYDPRAIACAATLPSRISERCVQLAHSLQLPLVGIDLRRTEEGEWFCFEANPSPGFTAFDRAGEISEAVADLLVHADSRVVHP
ncbi:MAG: RimK domain-containing protein ATP-grasp [Myxococcales bacterium]|nr:MAG: RimK domain-containing protein ATP-grasp [Myxococcales bacterium]